MRMNSERVLRHLGKGAYSGKAVADNDPPEREREVIDEPPPFLGSWPRVYRFVLIYLAGVITLFYFFTRAFRP